MDKPTQLNQSTQSALDIIRGRGQANTVLLVEQGRLSQAFLSRLFQSLGFEVVVAKTIDMAMQQLQKADPILICMNRYIDGRYCVCL